MRFTRKDIRAYSHWGNTQLKVHCQRLEDMEYLIIHRGGRGMPLVYELAWQGEGQDEQSHNQPFLMGLVNPEKLGYDAKGSALHSLLSASGRGQVDTQSVGGQAAPITLQATAHKASSLAAHTQRKNDKVNGTAAHPNPSASYSHSPAMTAEGGHA